MILKNSTDLTKKPTRIISLVPSQTELLHFLELELETIGITKFCVHPASWYREKTKIGGTKNIDVEKIISLEPDLIIANKEENVKDQVEKLALDFNVWVTDVNNLNDAIRMISDIGILTKKEIKANALTRLIKNEFTEDNVENYVLNNVAYLIWKDPYMTIGGDTFINNMLLQAGYKNIFDNTLRYPEVSVDLLQDLKPEYIFLSSEPYPFSNKHIELLQSALPDSKIILVNGEMFSWYGPRLLQAANYFNQLRLKI
jgi:ABC-type Fe3+-hydroxamate transport system substrate-binding protein